MSVRQESGALWRRDGQPLVVTHGGTAEHAYRDVLEALDGAVRAGADMFEFDVRRTVDGPLVVHHDEDIGGRMLHQLTLHEADAAAAAAGYRLPRLEELLYLARGALRLDVEMKEAGYEREILRALRDHGYGASDIVLTSFDAAAVSAVREADPKLATGLLVYDVTPAVAFQSFARSGAAFLGPDHVIVDDEMVRAAAASGIALVPWTVNDTAAMERLMRAAAVAAMITDRPRLAIDVRGRFGSAHS